MTGLTYLPTALNTLRDTAGQVNRIGPGHSLTDALRLIVDTAIRLVGSEAGEKPAAVIYVYDAEQACFDPGARVSAGESNGPVPGDSPRPTGMGAHAIQLRRRVLSYEDTQIPVHPVKREAGARTLVCYPLLVSGLPVGVLYVSLQVERRFTEEELLILDMFVYQAAIAIHNTRHVEGINRALRRKVDELERLQHAERLISSRLNLEETLREILNTALELTGAEHGSFRLLDKRAGVLRPGVVGGDKHEHGASLAVNESDSVMGRVAKHRRPVRIDDLREQPWAGIYRRLHPEHEMRSELAVPLLGPGEGLEGVLNVESPRLAAFDADAERVLKALATQAIIAIQEAKLLDTIEEVAGQIILHSPDELFALLIERACDLLNVSHGAIWEMEWSEPQTLTLRASTGMFPPRYQVPVAGSLLGTAVLTRHPVFSADLNSDARIRRRELARQMGWVSALIVPLLMRDDLPRGAFGVYTTEPRAFSDWDTRLLVWLANHAAIALQQAEALAQMNRAQERQTVAETFAALGDVAANLLHRVNNLIGVIPAQAQGIADKRPALQEDEYVVSALRDIEGSARAAMQAARESMAYLRPLRLQPTSIEACYQTMLARLTIPPHVRLSASGLDALPPVLAGEEQLRLVFFNLIENAVDALADRGGWISVRGRLVADPLDQARRWVEISVADNGPGVSPANREKIFEPDFSTRHSLKKLGFGLWWVKSLVQRFGGSIALAESAAPECVFIIRLPPVEQGKDL